MREGGVKGKGRKYAGGGTWSGQAQQDFGRGSAGQIGKYREKKEMQEEKEVRECGTRRNLNKNTKCKQSQLMQKIQGTNKKK